MPPSLHPANEKKEESFENVNLHKDLFGGKELKDLVEEGPCLTSNSQTKEEIPFRLFIHFRKHCQKIKFLV